MTPRGMAAAAVLLLFLAGAGFALLPGESEEDLLDGLRVDADDARDTTYYVRAGSSISISPVGNPGDAGFYYYVGSYAYNGSQSGLSMVDGGLSGAVLTPGEILAYIAVGDGADAGVCRINVISGSTFFDDSLGNPGSIGDEVVRTITFNANGGEGGYSIYVPDGFSFWFPMEGEFESVTDVKVHSPIYRNGYYLAGWSASAGASTPTFLPGDKGAAQGGSQTYYAVWKSLVNDFSSSNDARAEIPINAPAGSVVTLASNVSGSDHDAGQIYGIFADYNSSYHLSSVAITMKVGETQETIWDSKSLPLGTTSRTVGWVTFEFEDRWPTRVSGTPPDIGVYDVSLKVSGPENVSKRCEVMWHVSAYDDHRALALTGPDNLATSLSLASGDEGFVYYVAYGGLVDIPYASMAYEHAVPAEGFGLGGSAGHVSGTLAKVGRADVELWHGDLLSESVTVMSWDGDARLDFNPIRITDAYVLTQTTVDASEYCIATPPGADVTYSVSSPQNLSSISVTGSTVKLIPRNDGQASFVLSASAPWYAGASTTVTFTVGAQVRDYSVYAMTGETSISVPGESFPSSSLLRMELSAEKAGSGSIDSIQLNAPYKGMTVRSMTGEVTGIPTEAGTYVLTERYVLGTGQSYTRVVTVVVEDRIPNVDNKTVFESYIGERKSLPITDIGGYGSISTDGLNCSIQLVYVLEKRGYVYRSATYDYRTLIGDQTYSPVGQYINNSVRGYAMVLNAQGVYAEAEVSGSPSSTADYIGLSSGTYDRLVVGPRLPVGTYDVRLNMASTYLDSQFDTDCGGSPSENVGTHIVRAVKNDSVPAEFMGVTNGVLDEHFVMATNKAYVPLTLRSNLDGGVFSVVSYGSGITKNNVSVSQSGVVKSGSTAMASTGTYDVIVKVQDPDNQDNSATAVLKVDVSPALAITEVHISNRSWL